MSARLRFLVEEYRERLDRHQQLAKKTRVAIRDWNASMQLEKSVKLTTKHTPQKKKLFFTERSTLEPTTRVSLNELSKVLVTPARHDHKSLAGVTRFLSVKSVGRSKQLLPKLRTEQRLKGTQSVEMSPNRSMTLAPRQEPNSHLKFKLLSKSFHSVEDLFPVRQPSKMSLSVSKNLAPLLSYNPKQSELLALLHYHFQRNCRVMCVIKKHSLSLKVQYCHFQLPFDMLEPDMRKEWRSFLKRVIDMFGLNPQKKCFLFDLHGNPMNALLDLCRESSVVVLSNLPKLQFAIDQSMKSFFESKNTLLNNLYSSIGVTLHEYLTDGHIRMKERTGYIEQYKPHLFRFCDMPGSTVYANQPLIKEYQNIDMMYNRKVSEVPQPSTPDNRLSVFFRVSPKKKDFNSRELEIIQTKRNSLLHNETRLLRKKATSDKKLIGKLPYQLNHRDLLKKMAVKPDSHDFMLKTKFNREETLKVKSIYDSILAVALKNDQQATFRGINRQTVIEALAGFGFDTSPNLLRQILQQQEFVNWRGFLKLMESLIHKNSSESLDQYLETLGGTSSTHLNYQQVVNIICYGLEKLIIFKDSFYDGYELLFSKQLFKEMELATDQLMPVEDLRNFLQRQRKHKTFEYIFFE